MCCVPHLKTSDQGSRTCKALASGLPGELRPHLKPLGLGVESHGLELREWSSSSQERGAEPSEPLAKPGAGAGAGRGSQRVEGQQGPDVAPESRLAAEAGAPSPAR